VNRLGGDETTIITHEKRACGGDLIHCSLTLQGNAAEAWDSAVIPSGLARMISMLPGETALTRMSSAANSEARPRANPTKAISGLPASVRHHKLASEPRESGPNDTWILNSQNRPLGPRGPYMPPVSRTAWCHASSHCWATL
jgi:hypothetical protein